MGLHVLFVFTHAGMRPHVREGGATSEGVKEHDIHIELKNPIRAYMIKNALDNIFTLFQAICSMSRKKLFEEFSL